MCDYSLGLVASRPAKVGDKLVCTSFKNTVTLGFAAVEDTNTAVCLMPGAELAFEKGVRYRYGLFGILSRRASAKVACFCQVDQDHAHTHHDALQLPDGKVITLQQLIPGQRATVLQLPVQPQERRERAETMVSSPALAPALVGNRTAEGP